MSVRWRLCRPCRSRGEYRCEILCIRSTLSGNLLSAAFALSIARPKSDLLLEAIVMDFMDVSHLVIKDFPEACYLI
jgi:hypothetical protein